LPNGVTGVQVTVRLAPERRRFAKSMIRLIDIISLSDLKLQNSGRAGLLIFPTSDADLLAAVTLVRDRCTRVIQGIPAS